MAVTVTVAPRVQTAAKKLSTAETKIIGEFIRLIVVMGTNPTSAVGTAKAKMHPAAPADKELAFGGTNELVISEHHRVFYKLVGQAVFLTNIAPVAANKH